MSLHYDNNGFIIGISTSVGKVEQSVNGIKDDTQAIIDLLKNGQYQSSQQSRENNRNIQRAVTNSTRQAVNAITRSERVNNRTPARTSNNNSNNQSNTSNSSDNNQRRYTRTANTATNASNGVSGRTSSNRANTQTNNTDNRQRGADGRFIGNGSSATNSNSQLLKGIAEVFRASTDTQGIDPLIDSFKEVKDLASPLTKGFSLLKTGAKKSWSKFKTLKRKEPLPNEQARHNRNNEAILEDIRNDVRRGNRRGILSRLTDLLPNGGGRNRNLNNSRRGRRGASRFMRGGGKLLAGIGTALGVGMLANEWGNLDHKGKSAGVGGLVGGAGGAMAGGAIGATIGSVVPVVGTAIGGAIGMALGGYFGGNAGEMLGETASPYIQGWTNSLISSNIPQKMSSIFSFGANTLFTSLGLLTGVFSENWLSSSRSFFDGLTSISKTVGNSLSKVTDILSGIAKAVSNKASEVFENVSNTASNFADNVSSAYTSAKNWITGDDVEYRDYGGAKKNKNWLEYERGFNGKIRNKPLSKKLVKAMDFIGDMGLTMRVASGGQDAKGKGTRRTGSTRHDHGNSADVDFYDGKRKLSFKNKADRARLSEIVRRARGRGLTGFGAGGKNGAYMGDGRMHIGYGSKMVWGHQGKSANAPDWLVKANNAKAIKSESERGFINRIFGSGKNATNKGGGKQITQVLESGKGYNVVQLTDGSIEKRSGNWNWRNNNPGNISDGAFAKSMGAVSQKGAKGKNKRFAIFPTYEAGRKAKEKLIFGTKNYRNKTLKQAIARYAPSFENDTGWYQSSVLKAVGGRNKKMYQYTAQERQAIMNAMEKVEGYKKGKVSVLKKATRVNPKPTPKITAKAPQSIARPMPTAKIKPPIKMSMDKALSRLDSGGQKPMVLQANNQDIPQNISDRDLAHAVTGGMGGKYW